MAVPRKRRCSSLELGEAISKRLRRANQLLQAAIEPQSEAEAEKQGEVQPAKWPGCAARLLTLRAVSRTVLPSEELPPGKAAWALMQPLPPCPTRSLRSPPPGTLQWDIPYSKRAAFAYGEDARDSWLRARPRYLGYAEYARWLSCAVPDAELRPPVPEKEEEQASGLELLRLLAALKIPKKKRRVPPITLEEEKLADDALFGQGGADEVIASRFSVEVTRRQLECLRPGEWLNDEVINFYYKLLQERSKTGTTSPKCWFTNSFFWPKLSGNNKEYNYKEVRRWTIKAKIDVFEMDYIIFPMNIAETHWAMGAIDLKEKGFRYFDSMFSNPPSNFVAFLRRYLADEHKAKKSKDLPGVDGWKLLIPEPPVPQQRNGYDCGVFTCFFADCLSAGKPLAFDQDDMPILRKRIAARVMKADEKFDPIL
ncbi:SENP1 [Symbiodinium pilosum]|uniref:SENP1 protein n=1 Tax=Symbiodinium pilosum TaxID=2952 RepID=A0A812XP77_SYMPI|nr:SENP1 [Symbiodinium pilosum]